MCVCESNISSSVFESHGRPYFLFSLSKFTSQRKKGRGREGWLRYRTDSTFPSQATDLGDLLSLSLAVETCCFPLIACLYLFSDDPWFQPVVNHEN